MFNCTYLECNYAAKSVSILLKHIFSKHSMESNFSTKCLSSFCSKHFKSFHDLKAHLTHYHKEINVTLNFQEKTKNNCKYKCPSPDCGELIVDTKGLRSHLYKHLRVESNVFLNCFYKNCQQNYISNSIKSFADHFSNYHKIDDEVKDLFLNNAMEAEVSECSINVTGNFNSPIDLDVNTHAYINENLDYNLNTPYEGFNDVEDSFANNENYQQLIDAYHRMFNKYYSKYLIAKNVCNEIFNDFSELINLNNEIIRNTILSYNKPEISFDLVNQLLNSNPFNLIHKTNKSDVKKKEWCKKSEFYTEPKEIWIPINEKVYYIPILENLKSILKNKVIKNEFFKKKASSNNCISSFYDSKRYEERKIFSSFSDTIQIKLFIDECETCNPIGDNRKKYKMTGVYFKIGNLGNRFQSVNQLTFLVMLFKSQLLKNYSYASILKSLHQDLRLLETDGIIVEWNGELIKILGSISFICADSLGANAFGGLVESFNPKVKHYCRFCYGLNEEIQNKFLESEFVKRTQETHENDLINLSLQKNKENFNGVKSKGCLLDLHNFYSIGNLAPDIMHDLLEGCLPYEFSCMLKKLKILKILNPERIRESIKKFEYGRIDGKNKVPFYLIDEKKINSANQLTMSATHMSTLIRIFPLIFGFELQDNEFYKNFIRLVEIFRELNEFSFDEIKLNSIELKISEYLTTFKKIYPEKNIKPKQHFLIHYPESVRNFGPPVTYSTMRFESKHSFFKRVNNSVNNKKNIFKSLAERHQILQNYFLSSHNLVKELDYKIVVKPDSDKMRKLVETYNLLTPEILKWIECEGIDYHEGDLLRIRFENNLPKFAQIKTIVLYQNSYFFELKFFRTINYFNFLLSYEIVEENRFELINYEDIVFKFPFDLFIKNKRSFASFKF